MISIPWKRAVFAISNLIAKGSRKSELHVKKLFYLRVWRILDNNIDAEVKKKRKKKKKKDSAKANTLFHILFHKNLMCPFLILHLYNTFSWNTAS